MRRSGDDLWLVERTFAYAYVRDVHGLIEEGDEITSDLNGRVYAWFEKGVDPNG